MQQQQKKITRYAQKNSQEKINKTKENIPEKSGYKI